MSWLSNLVKPANLRAVVSVGAKALTGNISGAVQEVAGNARAEVGRVIARGNVSPEAAAVLQAQADNALNAAVASSSPGAGAPSLLNPLGAQGTQKVAIGSSTVSVNTLAMVAGGILLLVIILMVAKR